MALSNLLDSWDKEDKPESSSLLRRTLGDTAVSVAKGVANTGQAAVGLLDIPTLGYAGKALDYTGYNPEQTNQFLEELYTPEQQAANQEVQNANGFTETFGAAIANPSTIYHGVVESLPLMLGGQAIAKGAMSATPQLGRLAAGAMGEGTVTAGSQAEQIRQQTGDKLLTPAQAALAAGSGALTGGITALSGGLGSRLGAADIDTAFLGGQGGTGSAVSRFLKGGLTEGALEEMPQSAQEQMASNLALDKPVMEGVGSAGAQGGLLGFAQGGGSSAAFGGFGGRNIQPPSQAALSNNATDTTPIPPPTAQPTVQPTPAPIITGPLTNAVAQAPQLGAQPLSLPNLPADEIITFSDGSQARSSEVLQHLTTTGYTPEQAQGIVSNLLTQSKKDPQATAQAQQQAEQQQREQDLNAYLNVLSGNQENQRIAEGLKTEFEQTTLPKLQEQQQQEVLRREADTKAKEEAQVIRIAQPVIFNDNNDVFDTSGQAKRYAATNGLSKSHVAVRAFDGAWVLKRKDFDQPITPATINQFLPNQQQSSNETQALVSMTSQGISETGGVIGSGQTQAQPAQQSSPLQVLDDSFAFQAPSAQETPQPNQKTRKPIDHENDNLLTAIRKLGGLNKASFDANGGDSKFVKENGVNQLFRNDGGQTIDDLQRALRDEGFLQDDGNDQQLNNLLHEPDVKQRYSNARTNFDAVYADRLRETEQSPVIGTQPSPSVSPTSTTEANAGSPTYTLSTVTPESQPTSKAQATQGETKQPSTNKAKPEKQKQIKQESDDTKSRAYNDAVRIISGVIEQASNLFNENIANTDGAENKRAQKKLNKFLLDAVKKMGMYKTMPKEIEKEILNLVQDGALYNPLEAMDYEIVQKLITDYSKGLADYYNKQSPSVNDDYDDTIPFSKNQNQTERPYTSKQSLVQAMRKVLDGVFGSGWFNRLMATGKFKVVSRADVQSMGISPNAQAFYNPKDDTTYFVYDNIDQRTDLVKLMMHEIGVHALQMGKDSKGFENILNQVADLAKKSKNPIIQRAVKAARDANTPAHLMNEEIAGYLVEFHPKLSISQKILAWFRSQLRKLGITKINEKDLVYMASQALRNAPSDLLFDEPTRKEGIMESYAGQKAKNSDLSEEQRQYKEVEAKYFNEDGTPKAGAMLAPNGMPTNLNKMQWTQVRTPNFLNWFGDWINDPENASKVIDENGEPMPVFHGSNTQQLYIFDKEFIGSEYGQDEQGFFFTDDINEAEKYARTTSYGTPRDKSEYGDVIPAFLSIKKPHIVKIDFDPIDEWDNNYNDILNDANSKNADGVIVKAKKYQSMFVAFNPNQIKSATSNTGAFSKDNDDIRYSIRSTVTDFFTGEETRATTLDDIDTMLNTGRQPRRNTGLQYWKDKIVTAFADATRPFERFISDNLPPELASAILSGSDRALGVKAAFEREAMNLFGRDIGKAIRAIQKANPKFDYKTAKDLAGTWLSVRYAPIANDWLMQKDQQRVDDLIAQGAPQKEINKAKADQAKRIKAINDPKIIDVTKQPSDAGLAGGYNNATAQHLKDKIEAEIDVALLEKLADHVYDMNEWKLKQDIKNGKISQATADKFPKSRFYVPLTGDPRTDESLEDVFSVGSVNQAKDRAIGGRTTSLAQNGIDASFEQLEKSARYHGWKDFKDAIENAYDSLIKAKLDDGKTQKEAEAEVWEENQIKRRAEDGFIGENDIVVRKDGKGMIYTINNQAAMEALRSVNNEDVPSILKPIAYLTRLQARLVTQFMPLFAPANMIRDVAERTENIRTRKIQGFNGDMNKVANDAIKNAGRLLMSLKPVMMGVLAENTPLAKLFPVDNTNPDVQQLKRFLELGGSSTYGDILANDSKKLSEKLKATGTISDNAMEAIHLWNNAFELISGFSIYQSLVKQGLDERKAATASLNLMNFRKRGKYMNPIRALYMFAQPIATGGHQLSKTLLTPRGAARFAVYTVAAALLYSLLRSGDDDDELGINKMDEQGNFTLYRNILIPMGDGKYFKVPVGFGMQQLAWSHGVNLVRMAAGSMTPAETAAESIALWTKAAAPIAPAETAVLKHPLVWATQTFTPQIAKPIVNSALDVNAFGSPLTNARYEKEDKAKALQGRRDTPAWYKMAAEELARSTNGKVDMYPEQIRELLRGYGAGVGNEMLKWTIENPAKEERGLKTTSPLFDRYIQQSNDDSLKTRLYYRKRDLMNELEVKQSVGKELTPEEQKLVELNNELKKMESRARGKLSTARKAERLKQMAKANNLTKQADNIKQRYMDMALTARM